MQISQTRLHATRNIVSRMAGLLQAPFLAPAALGVSIAVKASVTPFLYFEPADFLVTAAVFILLGAGLHGGFSRFMKCGGKAAIAASITVLFVAHFDNLETYLLKLVLGGPFSFLARTAFLCAVMLGAYTSVVIWISRWAKCPGGVTFKINMVVLTWLAACLFELGYLHLRPRLIPIREFWADVRPWSTASSARPNIYLIVMDSYTSNQSLARHWGYDNSAFTKHLQSEGFQVFSNASSSAIYTYASMCAVLNMNTNMLHGYDTDIDNGQLYARGFAKLLRSEVPERLGRIGYTLHNFSPFRLRQTQPYYHYIAPVMPSDRTVANSIVGFFRKIFLRNWPSEPELYLENEKILRAIELTGTGNSVQPRFVYAHLMAPHSPYYYNGDGQLLKPAIHDASDKAAYLEQLRWVNGRISKIVNAICTQDTNGIIVLMGDHGFRRLSGEIRRDEESNSCFFALRLPGAQPQWFWDGIRPVDTFRLIFNHYFGANYPYLSHPTNRSAAIPDAKTAAPKP